MPAHRGRGDDASSLPASLICEDVLPSELGADVVERLLRGVPGQLDREQIDLGLIDERSTTYPVLVEQPMSCQRILPVVVKLELPSRLSDTFGKPDLPQPITRARTLADLVRCKKVTASVSSGACAMPHLHQLSSTYHRLSDPSIGR